MKAILTGGGRATRLRPITYTWNKHLIPLANKPMIFHAINKVVDAGITDIAINLNPGETELQKVVGDGSRWGAKIHYYEQQGGPLGVANVPKQAEEWIGNDSFLFYLSDNIVLGDLKKFVNRFKDEGHNCMLALSRVRDPHRFGVAEMIDGKIVSVEEKPEHPKSQYAVTGLYIYDNQYFDAYSSQKLSPRGEYEITDIHNWYIKNNKKVGHEEITGWWKDTGKPEDLLEGNQLLLDEIVASQVVMNGEVDPNAQIQGKVQIGKGTKISEDVLIRGPVAIGENCQISGSYIGPYTSIGNNSTVKDTEIEHSIVFNNVEINCGNRIVDSLIGQSAKVISTKNSLPRGHKLFVGDNSVIEI